MLFSLFLCIPFLFAVDSLSSSSSHSSPIPESASAHYPLSTSEESIDEGEISSSEEEDHHRDAIRQRIIAALAEAKTKAALKGKGERYCPMCLGRVPLAVLHKEIDMQRLHLDCYFVHLAFNRSIRQRNVTPFDLLPPLNSGQLSIINACKHD